MIIVIFTLVLLAANSLLLKPMYLKAIEDQMVEALQSIEPIEINALDEEWVETVKALSVGNDYDAVIVNEDQVVYSASPEIGVRQAEEGFRKPEPTLGKVDKNRLPFDANSVRKYVTEDIERVEHDPINPNETNQIIIYSRHIDSDLYVYMIQPLEPVNNSVILANRLLIICAVIFVVISIFIAMSIANQFSRPIKDIQKQVNSITKFDFSRSLSITTGDELEALGEDVNSLSKSLEMSLNQLNEQNKQLEKDVKSQKSFISNASHELRTPLALIKGYSEEIEAGYVKKPEQQQKYMSYISEEATKMSRLLDEILELSRLESGRMALREEAIYVRDAVAAFLDKYDGFIREQGLEVEIQVDMSLIGLHDPVRFEQVLANYISNAAKYGDSQKTIVIKGARINNRVVVTVFNTGSLIGKSVMDHLWDGFYMADEARSTSHNSYGLGLSIVKAIQEVGHNSYGANNVHGGVEFWFDMAEVNKD